MTITAEQAAKLLEGTTEGPWLREAQGVYAENGHKLIASVKSHDYGIAWPTTEANGNIMAAAPDLARALIASEAARKLAEERLAALIRRAHDAIIRDEKDGAVWAQLLADMAREIHNG